jgi:eukaryotic-like serine/threonine-protein kinase
MPAISTHPTTAALVAYGQGKLSAAEMAEIESHLATCATCGEALAATPDDTLLIRAREAATSGFRAREQTVATKRAVPHEIPQPLRDHPRYRVLGLIGAGGMGAVYKAEHRLMERLVALKVINPALVSSPAALERFEREVKTAAKLSHPNIVVALDAEQAGDLHYLVMEFVEGLSLDRLVASKGPLQPNFAARIIYDTALGLQHAHEKGMIHRDIKPQNLMRQRDGVIKILDFGLARLATQAWQSSPAALEAAERAEDATRAGALLGTPDYIAPEQASDAHLADIRADIYSLGCTLYFLLTGEPPFPGGTVLDKVHAHQTCTPTPIRLRRPDVPAELAEILERMLAKNPADRFARPADLAKALRPLAMAKATSAANAPLEIKAASQPAPTILAEPEPVQPALDNLSIDLLDATALPVVNKSLPASGSKPRKAKQEVSPLLWIGAAVTAILMIATMIWLLTGGTNGENKNNGKQQIARQQEIKQQEKTNKAQNDDKKGNGKTIPSVPPVNQNGALNQQGGSKASNASPVIDNRKKILMVLPQTQLFYPDYTYFVAGLPPTVKLETAATDITSPIRYFNGGEGPAGFYAEKNLYEINADDYAAILFIGATSNELTSGPGRAKTKELLDHFRKAGKPICALCAGQHVLAAHGLLTADRTVAGGEHAEKNPDFARCAAKRTGRGVHPDGNLITGALATDGGALARTLAAAIQRTGSP